MSVVTAQSKTKDFIIMGPEVRRGGHVLQALDALLYLPERFRLVFAGNPQDQSFYNEIVALVERLSLSDRVRFMYEPNGTDAIISDEDVYVPGAKTVTGDSPEALASEILRAARA